MPTIETPDAVARQIHAWKDALIDLTRRNPLVSLSLKAKSNLHIPDLSPDELYALHKQKRKPLLFVPSAKDVQPSLDWEDRGSRTDAGRPRKVGDIPIAPADLKALNTIRQRAALALQEQGLNTLFVAVGLLEWPGPPSLVAGRCLGLRRADLDASVAGVVAPASSLRAGLRETQSWRGGALRLVALAVSCLRVSTRAGDGRMSRKASVQRSTSARPC